MSTLTITVSRKAHLNIGNFGSVDPYVLITMDGVEPGRFSEKYSALSELLDATFANETLCLLREGLTHNKIGAEKYLEILEKNHSRILNIIEEQTEKIRKD
jgi:hypothetical protein